jgi:glycosyltransferase involved in cell wall biosynthesis
MRANELEERGIPLVEFPVRSFRDPAGVWSAVMGLRRYVRQQAVGVVHSFDLPGNVFLGLAAPLIRSSVVLTSQRCFRTMATPAQRLGLRVADRLADGIVVNCEAVRRHLIHDARVAPSQVHVCYNGLDARRFVRRPDTAPAEIPADAFAVGTVGVLRPEKGLPTLLEAFAVCLASNPQLFLVIVGDGGERPVLQRQARELGITSRCLFQAAVEDVAPWLSRMDVFVLPSISEALSNALMEAMACECACIASRVGGTLELLHEGETGLAFDAGDWRGLAAQLQAMAGDAELRRRLAAQGAAAVRSNFSLAAAARRLGAVYDDVLARGAS